MVRTRSILLACAATVATAMPIGLPASAAMAQEVVQPLPDPARADLSDALRRLSRNPENIRALVDAGNASIALGDFEAALGFFNRAQQVDPNDGRMLAGLAQVAVQRGEGVIAIQLFENANANGQTLTSVAGSRGLAYDLVGDNERAQRYYRQSLSREASDDVIRRLALSYAISGDAAASETTLLPLLQRQDRAAYRTRAFALAILGRDEEAIAIAETMLPPRLSGRLAPYLRYMPRLTRAQQAAAANLGRFPPASQIGQDSPQIAALSESATQSAPPVATDRLTPAGEPLGPAASPPATDANGELPALASADAPAVEAPAAEPPAREITFAEAQTPVVQPIPDSAPEELAPVSEIGEPPATVAELPAVTTPAPAEDVRPSFSISDLQPDPGGDLATTGDPVVEAVITAFEERTEEQLGLAEAFADFVLPEGELPVAPSDGAVDITTISPAREEVEEEEPAPPPPPAHPRRIWVQVATGQDVSAFRFDWRRIVRNADGLLEGFDAFTAPWNQTNRLVTGPFDSVRDANRLVTELGEAGIDAFRFTSAEGEEVRPLD